MRDLFNADMPEVSVDKPIRLIELFGGYGSQSMALERIGADFEPYFLCEFDEPAVRSYNAVHGTDFKPSDIRDVHGADLKICDTGRYFYLLTYSFPCTDLSVAGKMAGMAKGSGTRSGLLWEVERILRELYESGAELPQCLFMENVPQVVSEQNAGDFNSWRAFLQKLGYTSYLEILNAKDYGVAQNRERAFMLSFLGDVYYEFPKPIPLEKRLVDYLEEDVDEKNYLRSENAKRLIDDLIERGELDCKKKREMIMGVRNVLTERSSSKTLIPCKMNGVKDEMFLSMRERTIRDVGCEVASTIPARYYKGATGDGDNMVIERNVMNENVGINFWGSIYKQGTGYAEEKMGGGQTPVFTERHRTHYRIRKLTPRECGRLMGVKDSDIDKMAAVNSNSQLYKQFGNSIVVDVMCAMFRNLNIKGVS